MNVVSIIVTIRISVTRLPPSNSEELHDNGSDGNVEEEKNDQDEQAATDERPGDDEAPRM